MAKKYTKKEIPKYMVIRDSREKYGQGWIFEEDEYCKGTIINKLNSGDYSIQGLQDILTIERKKNTSELSQNINEKRFYSELKRMDEFDHPFLICEFTYDDIKAFPYNSGVPPRLWPKLRVNSGTILNKLIYIECKYKTKIIFAGNKGDEIATAIFKRMANIYEQKIV